MNFEVSDAGQITGPAASTDELPPRDPARNEPSPASMLAWPTVETARFAGKEVVLARHGDDWVVYVEQCVLMTNRWHDSEIALAAEALARVVEARRVLVGGLGLGYTLRAVLDRVSKDTEVTVAEVVPELVDWNRRILGALNDHPLDDPRCRIVGDVFNVIRSSPGEFDVVLLDVDNGPRALSQVKNQQIYGDIGVRACHAALRPEGVLAVWSAGPNAKYARRLERFAFDVEVLHVPARIGSRATHVLFLAKRRVD